MDYSIRIPLNPKRLKTLETKANSKEELPKIKDILFKPTGSNLKEFHPDKFAIRLREFTDEKKPSVLNKFTFTKTNSGYTDQREDLGIGTTIDLIQKAKELGYEKWGELSMHSTEYSIELDRHKVQVLSQEIVPIGTILKVESETQEGLNKALQLLSVKGSERIDKNAAVLLAEKLSLI